MPRGRSTLDRRQTLTTIGAATLGALGLGTGTVASHGNDRARANTDLADVRRATEQYHHVQAALDDGFVNTEQCVPEMGVHFIHPERMQTAEVRAECPEVLLYEPQQSGHGHVHYQLVAVEYFVAAAQVPEEERPPTLFGEAFDGPMEGHAPGEPKHFDLHAWVWRNNPNGVFEAHNPNVEC